MWCRALLLVSALSCTFLKEITASVDDLLCVLVLSGIQKDDLDVNVLKKLQRHNVNVDDLNNRETIESCFMQSKSQDTNKNESKSTTGIATIVNPTERMNSLNNVAYDMNLNSDREYLPSYENKTNTNVLELENLTTKRHDSNLINLWSTYKRLYRQKGDNVTKDSRAPPQLSISSEERSEIASHATNLAFLHKMVEDYIPLPLVRTESVTTEKPLDIVSLQILKYLKNGQIHQNTHLDDSLSGETHITESNKRRSQQKNDENAVIAEKENFKKLVSYKSEINLNNDTRRSSKPENIIELGITFNTTINRSGNVDSTIKQTDKDIQTTYPPLTIPVDNLQPPVLDLLRKMLNYIVTQRVSTNTGQTVSAKDISISPYIRKFLQYNNSLHDTNSNSLQKPVKSTTKSNYNKNESHIHEDEESFGAMTPGVLEKIIFDPSISKKANITKNNIITTKVYNKDLYKHVNMNVEDTSTPEMKYIDMFKAFIASKSTVVPHRPPATTNKDIDKILQEIKEFLENNSTHHTTIQIDKNTTQENNYTYSLPNINESDQNDDRLHINKMSLYNSRVNQVKLKMQLPSFSAEMKASYSDELDHLFDMFEGYLATKPTEAVITVSTSDSTEIDEIAQKIKEYLDKSKSYKKTYKRRNESNTDQKRTNTIYKLNNNDNNHVTHRTNNMKIVNKQNQQSLSQLNHQPTSEIRIKNVKPEAISLQEDIIKEITEKVKASVLRDLEKHIPFKINTTSTKTTATRTSTMATLIATKRKILKATTKSLKKYNIENVTKKVTEELENNSADKIRNRTAANEMAEFFELFKQFKNMRYSITTPKVVIHTVERSISPANEYHEPIKALPSLLPMQTDNNSKSMFNHPIYVNPYQGYHINKPIIQQTKITNEIREIGYVVPLPNIKHPASIIQTDAFQVPILAIPVSDSVSPINQNIIVTTPNPVVQYKKIYEHNLHTKKPTVYHDIVAHKHRIYDTDSVRLIERNFERPSDTDHATSDTDVDRYSDTYAPRYHSDVERDFRRSHRYEYIPHSTHFRRDHKPMLEAYQIPKPICHSSRCRQTTVVHHDYYKEYSDNGHPKEDVWDLIVPSQEHKHERFHEKLEKPGQWPKQTKVRQNKTPNMDNKMKVAAREQVSINDFKEKKKLYDDEHFFNFLQRQKKVNDMLERILAQKSDNIRSVETPDTIGT